MPKIRVQQVMIPEYNLINMYGSKLKLQIPEDFATCFIGFGVKRQNDNTFSEDLMIPVFDGYAHNNLYGRMMTIIEAVIENKERQKAIKDLVSKELADFNKELNRSVMELANGGNSSRNIYTR